MMIKLCVSIWLLASVAQAQSSDISGFVIDPSGGRVALAKLILTETSTGFESRTSTNREGSFVFPFLKTGSYELRVEASGFRTLSRPAIRLEVGQSSQMNLTLEVGKSTDSVTVSSDSAPVSSDPSVGTVVNRQFAENLPLNGRSLQSLIGLVPGVVIAPVKSSGSGGGQFNVNGQRDTANYFTVDGVSANVGINSGQQLGTSASGTLPGVNAVGGTNSLVSVDALQEFRLLTSNFAPEYGRTPGGQVLLVTRSGTNEMHGSLFDYFRNDALDANDWFANRAGQPRPRLRQNDFGGVLGGPLSIPKLYSGRDRTFFFLSYEGLRLRLPQTAVTTVPNSVARSTAPLALQAFLNAYPIANGTDLGGGIAQLTASYSDPGRIDATSIRIDHSVTDKERVFGRYNYSPTTVSTRDSGTLSTVNSSTTSLHTATVGLTSTLSPRFSNEFRFNFSRAENGVLTQNTSFLGATPPSIATLLPSFGQSPGSFIGFYSGDLPGLQVGGKTLNKLGQINLVDNFSAALGLHAVQAGIDFRRLTPTQDNFNGIYYQYVGFDSLGVVPSGQTPVPGTLFSSVTSYFYVQTGKTLPLDAKNYSFYVQDTWRASPRFQLTYGVRWDINPAPTSRSSPPLPGLTQVTDLSTTAYAPGKPFYNTTYGNFAPRVGIAYQLVKEPARETILRAGYGLFYDLAGGIVGNLGIVYPYNLAKYVPNATYPVSGETVAVPTPSAPYTGIGVNPDLRLPHVHHYNMAIERALGASQTVSVTYVGSAGRELLRYDLLGSVNTNFSQLELIRNTSSSDYNALQVQWNRRLSHGIQVLASYSWSHSLDDVSYEYRNGDTPANPKLDRASSDFDIRHQFNAAVTYSLPFRGTGVSRAILGGFAIDTVQTIRTALPVDLQSTTVSAGTAVGGAQIYLRPDVLPGQPLYLYNPQYPGGKAFNPVAFATPELGPDGTYLRQGTIGRNVLQGFPLYQTNLALRREFHLGEKLRLQFRTEAFNLVNHPNFGSPLGRTTNSLFGQSTSMYGRSTGSGGVTAGLSPLYQVGGPRSLQMALKLIF